MHTSKEGGEETGAQVEGLPWRGGEQDKEAWRLMEAGQSPPGGRWFFHLSRQEETAGSGA